MLSFFSLFVDDGNKDGNEVLVFQVDDEKWMMKNAPSWKISEIFRLKISRGK